MRGPARWIDDNPGRGRSSLLISMRCLGLFIAQNRLQDHGAYTERTMRRFASLLSIFMLLLTATPLLACMTDSAMNQEESACCRAMHGKCDGMAKMGCCQTDTRSDEHPQLAASAPVINSHFVVVNWLVPFFSEAQTVPPSQLQMPDEHSPPGLVTARITVLRI